MPGPCHGLNVCFPPNSHVEVLARKVIFRSGAFGMYLGLDEAMRVGPRGGISALLRGRDLSLSLHQELSEEVAVYRPRSGLSPGVESAGTLILGFQPPEL